MTGIQERARQCLRNIKWDPRWFLFALSLIVAGAVVVSGVLTISLQEVYPPDALNWIIFVPIVVGNIILGNAVAELWKYNQVQGVGDIGLAFGMLATIMAAAFIRGAGGFLNIILGVQEDLAQPNINFFPADEMDLASYQLGLFNYCCLAGAGLFEACTSLQQDPRQCVRNEDVYGSAFQSVRCEIVFANELCLNASNIISFNSNMYDFTSTGRFSVVERVYSVCGVLLFVLGLALVCFAGPPNPY